MSLSGIKTNMQKLDYAWSNPAAYSVIIPGLSLIIQKVQLASALPLIEDVKSHNILKANQQISRFSSICKWHLAGAMAQILATAFAVNYFAIPALALLAIIPVYQMIDIIIKRLRNSTSLHTLPSIKMPITTQSCIF